MVGNHTNETMPTVPGLGPIAAGIAQAQAQQLSLRTRIVLRVLCLIAWIVADTPELRDEVRHLRNHLNWELDRGR